MEQMGQRLSILLSRNRNCTIIEVSNSELVARALSVFWIAGCLSVLVDLDHLWSILGLEEPFNLTGWPSRPLHHPVVFVLYAIICGLLVVALINGWNVDVLVRD